MKNIIFLTLLLVSIQAMASFSYDFGNKDPKNAAFTTRWTVDITERKVIDGALHGVATGEDAHFAPVKVNLPLAKASIAIIEMMADEGAGCIQLFFNIGEPSSSFREQKLITDGKFHTYTFDLEKMPRLRNAGQVKTFRLDPCTGKGKHAFAIRSIRLVPRHKLLTDLALVVPKVPKKLIVPSFFQHPDGGPAVVPTSLELSYTDEAFIIDYESALNNVSYVAGS